MRLQIPGSDPLNLEHLVLDFNGTLAHDGVLLDGVPAALRGLAADLQIHVVTADTFGTAKAQLHDIPCRLAVLPTSDQAAAKAAFVRDLGATACVAIGNGRNDVEMVRQAGLGIVVVQGEGAAGAALAAADVVCPTIIAAFGLLLRPDRLAATLRQ